MLTHRNSKKGGVKTLRPGSMIPRSGWELDVNMELISLTFATLSQQHAIL